MDEWGWWDVRRGMGHAEVQVMFGLAHIFINLL